ncbi:sugar ABC transporter permease [Demequina sp. B12]|uniref:carbohydrate ABC transporter permease n=1 Tax=Demequina sp. B12 TaxID=2992757 RepID=UPI00237A0BFD|nr:sugar ABC transporter permease [Demequina sp. B12]MDE0572530.1 sugar ABC transporter permease [Demequina sp. B12]
MTTPAMTPSRLDDSPAVSKKPLGKILLPYLLVLPALVALLVGMGYPLGWQVFNSFREYGLAAQFGTASPEWVWFENYTTLLSDGTFWFILVKSIVFMAITASMTMILGIGLALLMKAVSRWARLTLQIAMLLAWAMPIVAQMTVWGWLIDKRNGVINYVLSWIPGVDLIGHDWLVNPITFYGIGSTIIVWASVPFVALSVYAALTQVSSEVKEAASLDGASGWQMLRRITMPIIRPVITILFLLQLIWDLRVYAQIRLLQDFGAGGTKYDLLGTYIYSLGIGQNQFGLASAAAMIVMFFTIGLSWYYVRQLLKEDN